MLTRKPPAGIDVETTLAHFAIITYMVDPAALCPHLHERFEPYCILAPDGTAKALISVVPFLDQDFRFARLPWPTWRFGQTNYRAYVTDSLSGEQVAWFFGTSLASATVAIPRFLWKLPWHRAQIHFSTTYDHTQRRYTDYRMKSKSKWAPATVELADSGLPPEELLGFPDLEAGLVLLTHPLRGYFYRRDGKLGSYTIWHDQLQPTMGRVVSAQWPLLQQLGLVNDGAGSAVHSVLMQPAVDFTIYLPPVAVDDALGLA